MLQAADILSAIASTSVGRHHLLYEDGGQSLSKKRLDILLWGIVNYHCNRAIFNYPIYSPMFVRNYIYFHIMSHPLTFCIIK